jgi:hypothetical protein
MQGGFDAINSRISAVMEMFDFGHRQLGIPICFDLSIERKLKDFNRPVRKHYHYVLRGRC